MMKKMILSILISILMTGCASIKGCRGIESKIEREQCEIADQKWYNESGWRYRYNDRR